MAGWACAECQAQVAPGAPRCPECPSIQFIEAEAEAGDVLKINRDGQVSDSADVREHPGTGVPVTGVGHPADGTMSPPVGNGGDGDLYYIGNGGIAGASGLEILKAAAEGAKSGAAPEPEPEPAPAPAAPPRTPPRRAAPPAVPRE